MGQLHFLMYFKLTVRKCNISNAGFVGIEICAIGNYTLGVILGSPCCSLFFPLFVVKFRFIQQVLQIMCPFRLPEDGNGDSLQNVT
jgi:hypothetical protein